MLQTGTAGLGDQLLDHSAPRYERHQPEQTLLYQIVDPDFLAQRAAEGKLLLAMSSGSCHYEKLVAFSCKRRGFCPGCGARRMVDSAALLVDEVLPEAYPPMDPNCSLSSPFPPRFLFAAYPELMSKVLGIVTRTLSTHLGNQAGFKKKDAHTGAVTLIQRFGSALNLNTHLDVHGRTNVASAWMRRSDHRLFPG